MNCKYFLLILFLGIPIGAETKLITQLEGYTVLTSIPQTDWGLSALGSGKLDLRSQGAENTKGQLTLNLTYSQVLLLDVSRAFVKYSLPQARVTLGKTVLNWGDGLIFNAGDLFFPDFDPSASLSAEVIKNKSLWLTALTIPLGELSYLEGVLSAPELNLLLPGNPHPWYEASVGGRWYGGFDGMGLQTGYLYTGESKLHSVFLSFNTALGGFNIYGSGATAQLLDNNTGNTWETVGQEETRLSLGVFQNLKLPWDRNFTYRFETILRPWQSSDPGMAFGEFSLELEDTQTLGIRLLVNINDWSTLSTLTYSWQLDRGFTLVLMPSLQTGRATDKFSMERPGAFTGLGGFRFVF